MESVLAINGFRFYHFIVALLSEPLGPSSTKISEPAWQIKAKVHVDPPFEGERYIRFTPLNLLQI